MNINLILAIILSIAALYIIYLVKSKTGKFFLFNVNCINNRVNTRCNI